MYKTVRHGENSLQYTILPQTDDFRTNPIDAEHHGRSGSRAGRPTSGKRKNKSSLWAYVGLFFVCSVVTGAILIPLLVTTDLMPSPATWFIKSQKAREIENKSVNIKVIEDEKPQAGPLSATFKPYTGKSRNTIIAPVLRENIKKSDTLSTVLLLSTKGGDIENGATTRLRTTSTTSGLNPTNIIMDENDENDLSENEIISNDIDKTIIKIETTSKLPTTFKTITPPPLPPPPPSTQTVEAQTITTPELSTTELSASPTTTPPPTTSSTSTIQTKTTALPSTTIKDNDYIIITSTLSSSSQPPPPPPPPPSSTKDDNSNTNNPRHNPSKPKILYQEITSRHNNTGGTASALNQSNTGNDYVAKIHLSPAEGVQQSDSKNWIKSHWPFVDPSTYFQWAVSKLHLTILID